MLYTYRKETSMRRHLCIAAIFALILALLTLVACGAPPETPSAPIVVIIQGTPVGSDQATLAAAQVQQKYAANLAAATAEIERANAQATLNSANATLSAAEIQQQNAEIALDDVRQQVGLQVRRASLDYTSAQAQLEAAQAQVRAADLALQTAQERYRAGAATLVEVTQARATDVQAASALVSARYNLLFQGKLLDYYVGDLDPKDVRLP